MTIGEGGGCPMVVQQSARLPYYWPCKVTRLEGLYHVSPMAMVGCDGLGRTKREAAANAKRALQSYLTSRKQEALLALGLPRYPELRSYLAGEMIRLEVELPF